MAKLQPVDYDPFGSGSTAGPTAVPVEGDPFAAKPELPYLGDRFKKGAAGLLSLAGAPVSLLATGLEYSPVAIASRKLGGPDMRFDDPVGGMGQVRRGYEQLFGVENLEAPTPAAKYRGGIAEFAGGGIVPGVGVVARAAHKIPAIIGEIGSTVLGGVGSEVAGPTGGIVGGVAGSVTPTAVSKSAGALPQLFRMGKSASDPARMAGKEIAGAVEAHPPSAQNVEDAEKVAQKLAQHGADFKPTLGTATGAPGVLNVERKLATDSGEALTRYNTRLGEMDAAIKTAKQSMFPASSQNVQRIADQRVRDATAKMEQRLAGINEQIERLASSIPAKPQQGAGEQLRRLRDSAQGAAREVKQGKLRSMYDEAERAGVKADMEDIGAFVKETEVADPNFFQNMPPVFAKVKKAYTAPELPSVGRDIPPDLRAAAEQAAGKRGPASFEEVHSLWRQANREYGDAMRAGDSQKMQYLGKLKEKLGEKVASFEGTDVGDRLKDFNKFYKEKYAPAFKEGVGGQMVGRGKYGETMNPEDVVKKFFTPSGIDDFKLIYGGGKEASDTLRDGVLSMFRQEAVRGGTVSQAAARTFMRKHGETLNKMPDVKAALSDIGKVNDELMGAASRMSERRKLIDRSRVAELAKTEKLDEAIDAAFADPKKMRALGSLGTDAGSKQAVARAIADRVEAAAEKAGIDALSMVTGNADTLRPIMNRLGPNHFENLETIAGAMTIRGRAGTAPKTANLPGKPADLVEQVTGSSPRTIWSQSVNTAAGRQSGTSAVLHLLSKFGIKMREEQAAKVMREAIYNPGLAKELARASNSKLPALKDAGNRFRDHLLAAGIRSEASATDDQTE